LAPLCAAKPEGAAAQADRVDEYELKAAVLYNLTKFVQWPSWSNAERRTRASICILGRDPFGDALPASVPGGAGEEGRVVIRRVRREEPIRDCQVLYISSSERQFLKEILSSLKGSGVLTVGETAGFALRGGMVQITLREQQVRFNINLDAAIQEDLKISAKLLSLARIVDDASGSPPAAKIGCWFQGKPC
jgi:hypothetical protein